MDQSTETPPCPWRLVRTAVSGLTALLALLSSITGCARSGDITAAAIGGIYNYNSLVGRETPPGGTGGPSSGDSWETCWGADDTLFASHDDGFGFGLGMPVVAPYVPGPVKPDADGPVACANHGLCRVDGDPNALTESVRGVNLNPGIYSYTLPATYSRDIYEVDGVLYAVKMYSNQRDRGFDGIHWDFFHAGLMKSTDGGRNWVDNLGRLNTPPPNSPEECMFSDPRMSWAAFIHYGRGGAAPAIDNAGKYVYLVSYDSFGGRAKDPDPRGAFLVRIARATLANLDKNDVEYFKGGDGMDDANWSRRADDSQPVLPVPFVCPKIVYSFAFQRYVLCNEFVAGVSLYTARHPWGPWTKIMNHATPGSYWGSLVCNKWTTADGKKMWYVASGAYKGTLYPYAFLFNPIYLSKGAVDAYEAANARRNGAVSLERDPDAEKYATGFENTGDGLRFAIGKIRGKGWHIVRLEYASTKKGVDSISVYVNGRKVKRIGPLCQRGEDAKRPRKWMDYSAIYYLNNGANTFEIRLDPGDSASGLMIRRLHVSRERTYDEGENVALNGVATASSAAPGSSAGAVNDGCAAGGANEWLSDGESAGAWVQLNWSDPVAIDKIVLYDRPDLAARVSSGTLTFSDDSAPIAVGHLQNDGKAGTVITFPPKTISWVRFTIGGSDSAVCGLAEFEAYRGARLVRISVVPKPTSMENPPG